MTPLRAEEKMRTKDWRTQGAQAQAFPRVT